VPLLTETFMRIAPQFTFDIVEFEPTTALQRAGGHIVDAATLPNYGSNCTSGETYLKFFQIETIGANGATGPIETTTTAVSRAAGHLRVANSALSWGDDDCLNGFCAQVKFRCYIPNDHATYLAPGGFVSLYSLSDISTGSTDMSNYVLASFTNANGGTVTLQGFRGGSQSFIAQATGVELSADGDYDLRLRVDPLVGVRLWLTGTGSVNVDVTDAGAFTAWASGNMDTHRLGSLYEVGDTNDEGVGSNTFKSVRLVHGVVPDSEIIGWS
jgi:hypothetical protein